MAELGLMQGIANPPIYISISVGSNPTSSVWEISSAVEQCADNAEVASSNLAFPITIIGSVSEWFKELVLKTSVLIAPLVRIQPLPLQILQSFRFS